MNYYKPEEYPYLLGRGTVAVRKDTEDVWQPLWHVKEFKTNIAADELEHENFSSGVKRVDRTAILKQKATFSFVIDVPVVENVLIFLLGDSVITDTQASGTWTAQDFVVTEAGKLQELGKRMLTITSITDDSTPTPVPLVLGTDYNIDLFNGVIQIIPGGVVGTADHFKVTGTYAEHTKYSVKGGQSPKSKKHIWFKGDPAEGVRVNVKGWGLLRPSGDFSFISDEWQGMTIEGSFMEHSEYGPLGFTYEDMGHVV